MNKNDSMDKLMRDYFSREEEPFVYKEKARKPLNFPAIAAALLVLMLVVSFLVKPEESSVKTETNKDVGAENSVNIVAATAVIEKPLSASPHSDSTNSVTNPESYAGGSEKEAKKVGIFVIDGSNLYGLKSRSLYQDSTFFRIRNSDLKQNWRLEWDSYTDLNSEFFAHENIIYPSDTFATVDENGYYKWVVEEEATERIALAYAPEQNLNDVVETIIYFNDGSYVRKVYDISYEGGTMMIYESSATIEGYNSIP